MYKVEILSAKDQEEKKRWISIWRGWPEHEVFAHPEYAALFCRNNEQAICVHWNGESGGVLFPLIVRQISDENWSNKQDNPVDLISPYGYGGPFFWGKADPDEFWDAFYQWAGEMKAISCFIRLSLFRTQVLPLREGVHEKAMNIVRTLDIAEDVMWMHYEHKVRKNVKRAINSGLKIELDMEGKRIDEFIRIYYETMDRRNACEAYRFDRSFFEVLKKELSGEYAFFHAFSNGEVVSTELVLLSKYNIYSFLGGTIAKAFELRPNDLLKHEIIQWGSRNGRKNYVLGGGYNGEDGIFRYKRSFAPDGQVPFKTGQIIFDMNGYDQLVDMRAEWEKKQGVLWKPQDGYFPAYRA